MQNQEILMIQWKWPKTSNLGKFGPKMPNFGPVVLEIVLRHSLLDVKIKDGRMDGSESLLKSVGPKTKLAQSSVFIRYLLVFLNTRFFIRNIGLGLV